MKLLFKQAEDAHGCIVPRLALLALGILLCGGHVADAQGAQPVVAIHDSEYTRGLENINASGGTPSGGGTTGKEWWTTDWHYFVMPEAVKEALKSDGTKFTVLGDSNIISGALLTNGLPKYPIVISLASEAILDSEIAQFTNYVAAGGFLFIGSSAFTRNTNGTTRGDFAFAAEMGVHSFNSTLNNWVQNSSYARQGSHRINSHVPGGTLTWRLPSSSEEIPWGTNPTRVYQQTHDVWRVVNSNATVIAQGDSSPFLTVKQYGQGYFIYCSAMQPLLGNGGWAPTMYAYLTLRRSIEWAFETANVPVMKVSPWPFQYDAAFMVRHDLENLSNEIAGAHSSALMEYTNGARGDYYFCTGTLREDMSGPYNTNTVINNLRGAIATNGATITTHQGGLKNANNLSLTRVDYDYWHWGTDEVLDITPAGYSSGSNYAYSSLSLSFHDIESWFSGLMTNGMRIWCSPYFDATREGSMNIQSHLNVKIAGEQKVAPFPHWTLSTVTPNKRFSILSQPLSDWFVGSQISHSMEAGHNTSTVRAEVDFYYNLGALINQYSHTLSTGLGPSGSTATDYLLYTTDTNRFPRLWLANGIGIYNWWLQRSNVQITVNYTTNDNQFSAQFGISGSTSTNTAVELITPAPSGFCTLQVFTNGVLAPTNIYRTQGHMVRLRVGTTVTNATINYYPQSPAAVVFSENFDALSTPSLPAGWSTSNTGLQAQWVTQSAVADTAPNAAFSANASGVGVNELVTPSINLSPGQAVIAFRNNYNMEAGSGGVAYDGGVLEVKIGTNSYQDIIVAGGSFVSGGYNSLIDAGFGNALSNRQAWSGNSGGFITTVANLPTLVSNSVVKFRWRCGTDDGGVSGAGWRIDGVVVTNLVCNCCDAGTNSPSLPAQTNRTVNELNSFSVTNTATDVDMPDDFLNYALQNAPSGAAIDSNGIITWTPSESQGPSTNTITTIVTDSGGRTATNSFSVIVNEVNSAPTLPVQNNRSVSEMTTLTVTNAASDSDLPANSLTYMLIAAPVGATISTNGVITWTPTEAQGPSTNTIVTVVSDGALSATNSFTVTVTGVNVAPVFVGTPTNRTVIELASLTVTNAATDADIPANVLNYSLQNPPAGAVISTNGVITWTPTEAQGPSTNTITTVVSDGALSATNSFTVTVTEVNVAPVFVGTPTNRTIVELATLTVTNNATDSDVPPNILIYSLQNPPSGAVISTNGVITWTPTEAQGPSTNTITTVVSDGALSATNSFTVTVTEVNVAPVFVGTPTNRTIVELATLTVTNNATDSDVPPNILIYSLQNPPSGAVISTNGVITWTPTEAQGPSTNTITTVVSDGALSATNSFTVTVTEVNVAPVFVGTPTNRTIVELATLTVTNNATDSDVPPNILIYSLQNPPSGAVISTNGVITWTPTEAQGPSTNTITTVVSDGALSATNSFTVTVTEVNVAPVFVGTPTNRTIAELTTLTVTNNATDADGPTSTLVYLLLDAPVGAVIDTNGVITWTPTEAQGPSTNTIVTVASDGALSATNSFTVTVTEVNVAPVFVGTPTNRTVVELASLTVTNAATDADIPANVLNYSLQNPPAGAVISTNGVITWTPTEAQGPSTNTIITIVSNGALSATNSFTVTVTEVNVAPVFVGTPTNRTIVELATLTVTNNATDSDVPPNILIYSLQNPPSGAVISTNGVITWTPTEAQGPSTNTITTVVSDGALSATNSFTVTVTEVNVAPVFVGTPTNRTIVELATLTVTNNATDSDVPPNILIYSLQNPPSGAVISTNGVITWTPTEAQGPSTNTITTVVSDGALSATNSFTVTVTEVNVAPVFVGTPTNRTIAELTTLTVTNNATDSDVPPNILNYSLQNPPSGAVISTNGVITWTPTEAQGPSTNTITTVVSDGALSATNSFTVTVTEVNVAPVFVGTPTNRAIAELTTLTVTNNATDADVPSNTLTYSLQNPPSGALISTNGVITWTPTETQGPSANTIITIVSDGALSTTNSFTVTVFEVNVAPVFVGTPNDRTIAELTALTVTNNATDADQLTNALSYSLQNAPDGALIDTNGVITWTPNELQGPGTNTITTIVSDGALNATNSFVVVVTEVNSAPVLPTQNNVVLAELTPLTVTNAATDTDVPANVMTYQLINAPAGATISASGLISWTPDESQGPSTNTITTVVNDGALNVTNSFDVVVTELNVAPAFVATPTNRTIQELATLTVTNTATDFDVPANTLTYSLGNPPAGATVDSNGVITWTPTEAQGPSTNTITTIVSDGDLSATNTFTVTVTEVNAAPVFIATPTNRTIPELTTLTVTNAATDADFPASLLTYSLLNPPGGAFIDANGVITWTPAEKEGPEVITITTVVSDGVLSATNSFLVTVSEVNIAPVFSTSPSNHTIAELATLTVTNRATDTDIPANLLTYSLQNPPAGATVDTNGVISWTPTEAQGPSTNSIVTIVSDGGLSATNSFTVVVIEVNVAPVFVVIPTNQTIGELTMVTVTNSAIDADVPANTLSYSLQSPPVGAVIDSKGVITWTPDESQGPSTNTITTVVSDGELSATNSFEIVVAEVNSAPVLPAQSNLVIPELSTLTVTNSATDSDVPANVLSYQLINAPAGASISAAGVISWIPTESQGPSTNELITVVSDGVLSATNSFFVIVAEVNSAPVLQSIANRTIHAGGSVSLHCIATDPDGSANKLQFSFGSTPPAGATINSTNGNFILTTTDADANTTNNFTVQVLDDGLPPLGDAKSFTVTVVGRPVIVSVFVTNEVATVTWSSIAGQAYRLQSKYGLTTPIWMDEGDDVIADGAVASQTNSVSGTSQRFYRVRLAP